jgi:thymidine phosphorylase
MSFDEAGLLTAGMAASGATLCWPAGEGQGPVVDKHSTGGVGDKVSLMLAPIAAACGCRVPMISGRGLGHTGGTLDKLSAIPGYDIAPDPDRFAAVVREVGCAIIGQTADLAPADQRLYAIRDVTATIESVPLITASILSKKMAAGNDALVLDVKVGSGAFMGTLDAARELARSLIATAARAGLPARAIVSDMNEPLGTCAGNALEVLEAVRFVRNEHREPRLNEITLTLAAHMLALGGLAPDIGAGRRRAEEALTSGAAAQAFGRMVSALGGPGDFVERAASYLGAAAVTLPVAAPAPGYLLAVDTRAVGEAIIGLGGGRRRSGDRLDLSVGFSDIAPIGTRRSAGEPLALVHAATGAAAREAAERYLAACTFGEAAPAARPVVIETLTAPPAQTGA